MAGHAGGGRTGPILLLLLVIVGGAGGWNYHRNYTAEAEEQGPRPFAAYREAELQALAAAYRAETEEKLRRYEAAKASRTVVRDRGLLGQRVREFERVQASSERRRQLTAQLARSQMRLAEIEAEQALRSNLGKGLELHLRRLTRI